MEEHPEKDDRISIQVVFQGGGAKLVGLLAAAKVIFDQKDKLNLRISRVSGTSAGALAGCILATGKDPELFRKDILRLAPSYMPTIQKSVGLHRGLAIVLGKPLYNSKNYRKFLKELFEASAGVTHLRELPTAVLFHATNIKNGVPMDFDGSRNEDTVEEVLFRSSALPFIFETFKGQPYVDGGLISNFPAYNLGASPGFENDQIIGFSFPATGDYPFDEGFFSYSKSLMFTAMDVSIARARYELPPQNVARFKPA
jgi:predicted acylesterase/phospholipase RssA